MARTPCCDKSGMRKGTWTSEEDRKLTAYVTRYGCWNWRQLPKYAGLSRCGKSCRLRWMNYLRPNLKRGRYSKEEDELIIKLRESLGNRWSAIAAYFPGRTDSDIKNHWHTGLKKASKQGSNEKTSRRSKNPSRSNRGRRMENHEKSPVNPPTQEILESSEFSSQPSTTSSVTSSENCSSSPASSNTVATDFRSVVGESDGFMAEIVGEPIGSFWTEPFLTDNYSTITYPPSPFAADVLLSSYDYFYDNNDMNTLIW